MLHEDKGVYVLVIDLKKKCDITIGKMGTLPFMPGKYLYVGRAKHHLNGRLRRHLRRDKKRFWHIDYLLQEAQIEEIWIKRNFFDECRTASNVLSLCRNESIPLLGFGSSDCRCPSHLIHFSGQKQILPRFLKSLELEKVKIYGYQS